MSRSVEIALAAGSLPMFAGGLGALALGAGGVAYGTYLLLKRLHEDYQEGVQEFHCQSDIEARVRQGLAVREREKTDEALASIALTRATTSTDVNAEFLRHRVEGLQERHAHGTDDQFTQQCRELLAEIAQAPERFNAHLESYRRLADAAVAKPRSTRDTLPEEIAALREEILSPLLDIPEAAETRAQLLSQLDALQEVAVRQRTVARQGLTVLRRRVYREIKMQAERRETQARAAEARRNLVSDTLARLQAVMRLPEMPDFTERAREMGARLSEALARDDEKLAEIQQLAGQAGELFAACEKALSEQVMSAYIEEELTEVMVSLGYQVTRIPGEDSFQHRLVTTVDDAHGIEFEVDSGHIKSEMVALTPDASVTDPQAEEKVCHIMDQFIATFKAHHQGSREVFRTSLQPEEELRVVEIAEEETITADSARKEIRIEEL
jgi:hypothetical protein